jgi:manganese/zinc/iron transport system substrate-binding protein
MKIIKKLVILFLFGAGGCTQSIDSSSPPPPPSHKRVLSTIAQIGNLVEEIGKGRIESQVLVRRELNPHSYELVKGDDEKIQKADLILFNGLGLEHGASVSALLATHPKAFAVGAEVMRRLPQKILWQEAVVDPHLWMDVSLWRECVDPILEQLIEIDPEGAPLYRAQADTLKRKMEEEDLAIYKILQSDT